MKRKNKVYTSDKDGSTWVKKPNGERTQFKGNTSNTFDAKKPVKK